MKKRIKDYLLIISGALIMAVGYNMFLIPGRIASGGAGGIATALNIRYGINVSVTVLLVNLVLFIISWSKMPRKIFIRSAVGTVALTIFLEVLGNIPAFGNDVFLSATFGGVIMGAGVGMVIRSNASTGGSDFLAVILHTVFKHISVAKLILLIDGVIIISGGFLLGNYTNMLYASVSAYIAVKVADSIVEGGVSAKSVYIISDKSHEIADIIMDKLHRGVTGIYGKGMYTDIDTTVLLCVVKRNEIPRLKEIVGKADENAFIILSEAREVFGKGF